MTPTQFIAKWKPVALTERAAAHSHFIDLCRLLGHDDPVTADPTGQDFAFEKGATKSGGGEGFADVWKRSHFAWEYKKKKRDLNVALDQLVRYAAALENPPLQVACDTNRFLIRTAWTNAVPETHDIALDELVKPSRLDILHSVFFDPEKLRPKQTRAALTREAADKFSTIALRLQGQGSAEDIAHFVNQLVFCFFASSVKLLPDGFFPKLLKRAGQKPERALDNFDKLFAAMETGGEFDLTDIAWFNGGLFDGRRALKLDTGDLGLLQAAATLDWGQIDPTIFGTLFERFLDPGKRKQIGAHYTDADKIMMIVEPVVLRPLRAEWAAAKADIDAVMAEAEQKRPVLFGGGARGAAERAIAPFIEKADAIRSRFLDRLRAVRILDPACGSGNFLYLALQGLRDIENTANLECEALGLPPRQLAIGPENLLGIDINPVACELARTTIWIGNIQWERRNGVYFAEPPILRKLDNIECRDALIEPAPSAASSPYPLPVLRSEAEPRLEGAGEGGVGGRPQAAALESFSHGEKVARESFSQGEKVAAERPDEEARRSMSREPADAEHPHPPPATPSPHGRERTAFPGWREAPWPAAEFIVGNPPFLGGKLLRTGLGDETVETLFEVYAGRVPPEADLVTYWFEKARMQLKLGRARRAGLVATNSIRGGANRRVLERVAADAPIFEAWSDEPWIVEGAAVRVSLVCFSTLGPPKALNGQHVTAINADLTSTSADLTKSRFLIQNHGYASNGITKKGKFEVDGATARYWLTDGHNPSPRSNRDVLRPWLNGKHLTRDPSADMWIIDLSRFDESDASQYEGPFEYVRKAVKPFRDRSRALSERKRWWKIARPAGDLFRRVANLNRFIVTPEVAKHRVFVFVPLGICPDKNLIAITRDDDTTFGILHSRFHEAWSLRLGTSLEDRPRYTPTTTFETFPFPAGLTPNIPAADYADDPRAQAIAAAAKRLDELRNAWLNPPDLVRIEPEIVPGYPDRILPRDVVAAAKLKERTLTKLYNARPQWLADAHRDLDAAVAAAYGWPADIAEEDVLAKLLELNLERACQQESGPATSPLRGGRERRKPLRAGVAAEPVEPVPLVSRAAFAQISAVEGIRLTDEQKAIFADFDHRGLPAEDRRRAIIARFRDAAK